MIGPTRRMRSLQRLAWFDMYVKNPATPRTQP